MRIHPPLAVATLLACALSGLVLASPLQAGPWTDPPARAPAAPAAAPAVPTESAAAMPARAPAEAAPVRADADAGPVRTAKADRPPLARPPLARSTVARPVRYAGGLGSVWRTGHDSHAFAARWGGCRLTGFAGPAGFRLVRAC